MVQRYEISSDFLAVFLNYWIFFICFLLPSTLFHGFFCNFAPKQEYVMPRKTDGIEFEIHPRPTKGEDGKPLLYVRPAKGRKKSFKDLETFCNKYRNLRTGELQMVMDVVMEVVGLWLSDGYRVETPLGSFAPKLKLMGEHTNPKTIHGRDVRYAGIEFIPSKEFVKEGGQNREGYRKSQEPVGNSQMHDQQAMDEALRRSMRLGYTTIPSRRWLYFPKKDKAKE